MNDELQKFLADVETDNQGDPFANLGNEANQEQKDNSNDDDSNASNSHDAELKPRNRRERRLKDRLEAERQTSSQMAAQLAAITEAQKSRNGENADDYLNSIERIYGTESPEAREATELLKHALKQVKAEATREAVDVFEETRRKEAEAVVHAEAMLDRMVEDIEDEFDVDLSSKEAEQTRTDFYRLLEKMSPKDEDGNITYYADPFAVWETYQEKKQRKNDSTAKNLAARSMTNGAANNQRPDLEAEATERYLRSIGII